MTGGKVSCEAGEDADLSLPSPHTLISESSAARWSHVKRLTGVNSNCV